MSTNQEPGREAAFFTTIRSWGITRSDERVFGGVATGVGERIGLARVPARILTVIAAFALGGFITLAYAAAWALLPDRKGRIIIQDFGRGVPNVGALIVIGLLALLGFNTLGDTGIGNGFHLWNWGGQELMTWPTPLGVVGSIVGAIVFFAIVGGIVAVIVWAVREGRKSPPSPPSHGAPPETSPNDGGDSTAAPVPPVAPTGAASEDDKTATAQDASAPEQAPASAYAAPGPSYSAASAPTRTYATPTPRAPRVPGPGPAGYLTALALLPLSFAIAYWLEYQGRLSVYPWVAAGAIFAAGLGIIVAIVALAGRRLGFLGFVATLTLIPVSFGIVQADEIRSTYEHGISWTWEHAAADPIPSMAAEPVPSMGPGAFDASSAFAADYAFVQLDALCSERPSTPDRAAPVTRLSAVTADVSFDVTAPTTRVVVPAGTSLTIVQGNTSRVGKFSVQWLNRSIECDPLPTAGASVTLTNPGAPVVTLRMTNDTEYQTVQIEEQS